MDLGYLIQEEEPEASAEYKDFPSSGEPPLRLLNGRRINFELDTSTDIDDSAIGWDGTLNVSSTGGGKRTYQIFLGPASTSDTDYRTVISKIYSHAVANEDVLVCDHVLGIHSNVGPDSGFSSGHAWITLANWENGFIATTQRIGLWPDEHPLTTDNGDGSDVRYGLEQSDLSAYNRFYLLSPSELQNLINYLNTTEDWTYLNTCANWAEGAVEAAVGETVDSSDFVLFGTPRKISESIQALEESDPTTKLAPRDSGADVEEGTSTGESSWDGSSFLD